MMLIVQKYGGTSLGDGERMMAAARRVARLHQQGAQMVVVVSAQGEKNYLPLCAKNFLEMLITDTEKS